MNVKVHALSVRAAEVGFKQRAGVRGQWPANNQFLLAPDHYPLAPEPWLL